MSYEIWSTAGYGIRVDDIHFDKSSLLRLIELAPKYKNTLATNGFFEAIKEVPEGDEDAAYEFAEDFFCDETYGQQDIAGPLFAVLNEMCAEKFGPIPFDTLMTYADDYDGRQYILICPFYPWGKSGKWLKDALNKYSDLETVFTELFEKATSAASVTGKPILVDYYKVENGG